MIALVLLALAAGGLVLWQLSGMYDKKPRRGKRTYGGRMLEAREWEGPMLYPKGSAEDQPMLYPDDLYPKNYAAELGSNGKPLYPKNYAAELGSNGKPLYPKNYATTARPATMRPPVRTMEAVGLPEPAEPRFDDIALSSAPF